MKAKLVSLSGSIFSAGSITNKKRTLGPFCLRARSLVHATRARARQRGSLVNSSKDFSVSSSVMDEHHAEGGHAVLRCQPCTVESAGLAGSSRGFLVFCADRDLIVPKTFGVVLGIHSRPSDALDQDAEPAQDPDSPRGRRTLRGARSCGSARLVSSSRKGSGGD